MTEENKRLLAEFADLQHAMQSGVAMQQRYPALTDETAGAGLASSVDLLRIAKHLRVGVNSALVEGAALAGLLIDKGLITEAEYLTAIRDGMRREVDKYERQLAQVLGKPVKLV